MAQFDVHQNRNEADQGALSTTPRCPVGSARSAGHPGRHPDGPRRDCADAQHGDPDARPEDGRKVLCPHDASVGRHFPTRAGTCRRQLRRASRQDTGCARHAHHGHLSSLRQTLLRRNVERSGRPADHLAEHRGRQPPGLRVVAAAVIGVDQPQPVRKSMFGPMREAQRPAPEAQCRQAPRHVRSRPAPG